MADLDRDAPVYSIGVVAQLTGLTPRQIRYYEKAGILQPRRTPGNQRLYSLNQVELLREVKALLSQGHTLEKVKARLAAGSGPGSAGSGPPSGAAAFTGGPGPEAGEADATDPSSREAWRHVQTLRSGRPLSSLYPVNNQAELARKLHESRSTDSS